MKYYHDFSGKKHKVHQFLPRENEGKWWVKTFCLSIKNLEKIARIPLHFYDTKSVRLRIDEVTEDEAGVYLGVKFGYDSLEFEKNITVYKVPEKYYITSSSTRYSKKVVPIYQMSVYFGSNGSLTSYFDVKKIENPNYFLDFVSILLTQYTEKDGLPI